MFATRKHTFDGQPRYPARVEPNKSNNASIPDLTEDDAGQRNVFADLGFGKAEAENLKLRAELMMRIEEFYRKSGKIGLFSLDALVNVANRAGLNVRLVVRKAA